MTKNKTVKYKKGRVRNIRKMTKRYRNKSSKKKYKGGENRVRFVIMTAKWCGHCIELSPIIKELEGKLSDYVTFIHIDSESIEKGLNAITDVKIERPSGFPSLGKIVNKTYIEYHGKRDIESLTYFLNSK